PAHWSHGNPVDVLGDAGAERYTRALDACLKDPNIDGVLVMLTPQAMTDPMAVAEAVIRQPKPAGKLVLTSWMGGSRVLAGRDGFAAAGIPSFPSPERAVEAFAYLANYQRNQALLRQVPGPLDPRREADVEGARLIVETALAEGRRVLTGIEAYALLSAFRI